MQELCKCGKPHAPWILRDNDLGGVREEWNFAVKSHRAKALERILGTIVSRISVLRARRGDRKF
jgi:hypothetical protein